MFSNMPVDIEFQSDLKRVLVFFFPSRLKAETKYLQISALKIRLHVHMWKCVHELLIIL